MSFTNAERRRIESITAIRAAEAAEKERFESEALWHAVWQEDWLGDAVETQHRLRQQAAQQRLSDQIRMETAITDLDAP